MFCLQTAVLYVLLSCTFPSSEELFIPQQAHCFASNFIFWVNGTGKFTCYHRVLSKNLRGSAVIFC